MNLNQFEYLLAIYQQGSITKAAQQLFVSAPAISNAIKSLEEELGYSILIRQQNGVLFTDEGSEVVTVLQEIQDRLMRLRQIGSEENKVSGEFTLGGASHFNSSVLLKFIVEMQERYPNLKLHLLSGDSDSVISNVGQSVVDIGLIVMCELDKPMLWREIKRNQLKYSKVIEDEMRFVAKARHPLFEKASFTIQDIFQYPYICHVEAVKNYVPDFFDILLSELPKGIEKKDDRESWSMIRINDRESLYEMLLVTDGVTLMPYINRKYLAEKHPELQYLPLSDPRLLCEIGLIHKERTVGYVENLLWKELKDFLQREMIAI